MNKNLLVIAVSIWMFTGCVSSKVERLHTTSTTLSTTFDKYEQTIDKALVFNRVTQEYNNRIILTSGLYPYQDDSTQPPEIWFSSSYSILNHNMLINEAISQQNKDLASYFKKLPLILEDKKADIAGLVKNIDVLNQVIEKNLEKGEELKEGLDKNQNDVITKSLSSAYSYYQYHIYKKTWMIVFLLFCKHCYIKN